MSSGHVFGPADPPNSPLEKLLVPNKGRALWKLERDLMNSGLEVEVARNLVRAFKNYEVEREYEELKNYQELEYWANRHTHGGTAGGPSGSPQVIALVSAQRDSLNILQSYDMDDGTILTTHSRTSTLCLTQDSQGYFYQSDTAGKIHKITEAWGVEWSTDTSTHANYLQDQRIIRATSSGLLAMGSQYTIGVMESDGTLRWLIDPRPLFTVTGSQVGVSAAISPDGNRVVWVGSGIAGCFDAADGTMVWEKTITTDLDSRVEDVGFTGDSQGVIICRRGIVERRAISDGTVDWSQNFPDGWMLHPRPYGDNLWIYDHDSFSDCHLLSLDPETGLTLIDYPLVGAVFDQYIGAALRGNLFVTPDIAYLMESHPEASTRDNKFFKIDLLTGDYIWTTDPANSNYLAVLHTLKA